MVDFRLRAGNIQEEHHVTPASKERLKNRVGTCCKTQLAHPVFKHHITLGTIITKYSDTL